MTIRPMETRDAHALHALEVLCFSDPWSEQAFLEECENEQARFLVLETEGAVRAYAGMHAVLDEGYIANVAVDPAFRRRHLGDALIRELIGRAEADGLSFVTLEVRESNTAAIALYRKHGFVPVGKRPRFYEDPREDALLMTRTNCKKGE